MLELLEELERNCSGTPCVVVCVTASRGSSPRKTGSRMLVGPDGLIYGTVGGGYIELKAIELAQTMMESNERTRTAHFEMNGLAGSNTPMVCGGEVELFFQLISCPSS